MWGLFKSNRQGGGQITLSPHFIDYCITNHSLGCSFDPERKEPPKVNTLEGAAMGMLCCMEAWKNGGIETGRYYLIVICNAPETLSGIGPSKNPVLHVLKLLEFVETGGKTLQGVASGYYKLEAQGLPPNEVNDYVDTSHHAGRIVHVERILFEDKVLAPIYMSDIHDHELKNSIGIALRFG